MKISFLLFQAVLRIMSLAISMFFFYGIFWVWYEIDMSQFYTIPTLIMVTIFGTFLAIVFLAMTFYYDENAHKTLGKE